ncbi:DUF397 domain-containing protein [Streptomyces cavernicola]|uniref:DUF397 domain-containing protein n=1 Tax=Streptomyces cavernicola TaxID=3043613 RepID=A0ABT6SBL7_9ACTN|nr:DUF397 domain-containing protein [Streptomyces sp. B-S-A6]MDI3405354.1 DUF397 domain-containing protein [Streptomyces sp. B-S-A6]
MNVEEPHDASEPELGWFTSSHSSGAGGECVEVARGAASVHVRDSKRLAQGGPVLTVEPSAWAEFLQGL